MPLRSVKMNRFIFGFQRRVWCPKCTPLSSSCFMLTTAIAASLVCARPPAALLGCDAGTGWCAALASGGATHPAIACRDRGGGPPRGSGMRTREVDPSERAAPDSIREPDRGPSPAVPSSTDRPGQRHPPPFSASVPPMRAPLLAFLLLGSTVLFAPMPATAEPTSAPSPAPDRGVLWSPPMDGDLTVTRPFDPPPHPFAAGHRGADLRGTPWTPVLAAGNGVVVFAGWVAGRPVVSIDHPGGLRTTYEPVASSVAAGQTVARGSPIGTLAAGHGGCPVEACLHWGLRRGETYLDPLSLLQRPGVRLLPIE